jgi:N-formylglutamate deformylase
MTPWLHITRGNAPLLVTIPHTGTQIPDEVGGKPDQALALTDTDWHIDRLYAFAATLGATIIRTDIARTVIDVNRDPSGASLYPGQATTGLCPTTTFEGVPLYAPGSEPDAAAIAERRDRYFAPYHMTLIGEIARLRTSHPHIVLYDAHSIRSEVPRLFEGLLPHFNIGTAGGASCAPDLTTAVERICHATPNETVVNGRFKGGWTTRHYGRPEAGVHAIQMELAQRLYLDESANPPAWHAASAAALEPVLSAILTACIDFAKARS